MSTQRNFKACLAKVKNRGIPPRKFLDELVEWALTAPDFIFEPNKHADIYWSVKAVLGPWESLLHRKAVMLEVLRVLAGFESSWRWDCGRDVTNSTSGTPETEETGIFQVSCNATHFDKSLVEYVNLAIGRKGRLIDWPVECQRFIPAMKKDHRFAIEFMARLARFTTRHNGPLARHEVDQYLSRDAVAEFQSFLK